MKLQKSISLAALVPYALAFPHLANYEHRSLAGLSRREVEAMIVNFDSMPGPQPIPPPINDTSSKLVNDADHPFEPLRPGDIRGPCPGLNTLASHGYLNRTGVVTPGEIITAVQEGFNLGHQFASFLAYTAFITDGNHLTNMMTIGQNMTVGDEFVTGLNTHGHFEGDGSMSRKDAFFGNNFDFVESIFDVFKKAADEVGGGVITVEASALDRRLRVLDSIARNPEFAYQTPRFVGATAESAFILGMFAHNQTSDTAKALTLDEARHFFDFHRFPDGFFRRQDPFEFPKIVNLTDRIIDLVGIRPGHNEGKGNYIVDESDTADFCLFYQRQVNFTASLYPDPPPALEAAIKTNLQTYYQALGNSSCQQIFPYGM